MEPPAMPLPSSDPAPPSYPARPPAPVSPYPAPPRSTTLTPPPPPPPGERRAPAIQAPFKLPVAGQLTLGWRLTTGVVWALAFVGLVAVWKTSRELGLNTWWLGPIGDPASPIITMLPFLPAVAMILLAVNNVRRLPWCGLAAAVLTAVVGVFDLGRVTRLALVELAIAGAGALAAFGGFAGRYRPASSTAEGSRFGGR